MDWSRAKSILIFAFLITNIILVSVLVSNERSMEPTIQQEFIQDTRELLENKNIFIETEIPKEIPSLNTLIVEYETIDISKVNQDFFLNKGIIKDNEEGVAKVLKDKESVTIENKKKLIYENKNKEDKDKYKNLTEEEAKDIALRFLEDKKYDINDIKLSYFKEGYSEYYLNFSKIHNGRYLETAYINVVVDSRGVKELESLWLNAESEGETLIHINTAPKALLTLLSMDEAYGRTITDISLAYYFDPKEHDHIENPEEAKKGKTIPAWRVFFDDGYKIIIDNY